MGKQENKFGVVDVDGDATMRDREDLDDRHTEGKKDDDGNAPVPDKV